MVVVNANPDVSKQVPITGFVTVTTSVGAPGPLKATCTVSVSNLVATVGWAAAPFLTTAGITTYEIDYSNDKMKTWTQITKATDGTALGNVTGTSHAWTATAGGEYFFRVRAKATAGTGPNMDCNIINKVTTGKILKKSDEPDSPVVWDPTANASKRGTW